MKRVKLERHLRAAGAVFLRHGGNHDRWRNPANGRKTSVSRQNELSPQDVRSICKDLDIPPPPKVS